MTRLSSTVAPALIVPTHRRCAGTDLHIVGPHGVSIAGGARKRREVTVSAQVFGQHQPNCVQQARQFRFVGSQLGGMLLDDVPGLGKRQ